MDDLTAKKIAAAEAQQELEGTTGRIIREEIERIFQRFCDMENITYQEFRVMYSEMKAVKRLESLLSEKIETYKSATLRKEYKNERHS